MPVAALSLDRKKLPVPARNAGNAGRGGPARAAACDWDQEKLDHFIAKPDEVVPGNNMKPYGGLTSAEDRANVIVFLEHYQLSRYSRPDP